MGKAKVAAKEAKEAESLGVETVFFFNQYLRGYFMVTTQKDILYI